MLVYLAGPITGLSFEDCIDWRQKAIDHLKHFGIQGLSPLRSKDYLLGETTVADSYDDKVLSSQRGIYARDRFDCHRSDAVLVNMLGAKRVSIGTVMEIAWAAQNNTPVVLIMEKEGNVHEHSMLREACPFRVDNLEDALFVVTALLAPTYKA
jgi:nucleoside 2-deoxyribosyltransferase